MPRRLSLLLIAVLLGCSFGGHAQRIVWWNIENLFDCAHDSLKQDTEFTPEGNHHWTRTRYWRKLDDLSRTIAAIAGEGAWPLAVGLCEVENDSVLRDLTRRSPLRMAHYAYIHEESPDVRGIDVALIFDSLQYRPLGHEAVRIPSAEQGYRPTRDILHVWGECFAMSDTLHFVLVHLPSKAGSGKKGDAHRRLAVQTLCALLDELSGKNVMLMGDFNAEPDDKIFRHICLRMTSLMPQKRKELRKASGTYYFRRTWSYLDHILVSPRLLKFTEERISVGTFPFLLTQEGAPKRTFRGPVYNGGISDHLPIWMDLLSR